MEDIFDRLIRREGGYVHDPVDPGGESKWGISKRSYPHLDIKSLTKEDARAIYYRDYFVRYGINTLPECLQELMLDWAVHSGRVAVKTLQRLTGARDDGIIGVETLQRLTDVSLSSLKTQLVGERLRFYARLVQRNPSLAKYIVGWINRTLEFL